MMEPYGPDHIRALRGGQSRAAFAERLGVTPLTVYRWELPATASEARRPRGKVLNRLIEATGGTAPEPAFHEDGAESVDAALALLATGDWRSAEEGLVRALAAGIPEVARVRAAIGLARVLLFARSDTRGAFSTLIPMLNEAVRLPPDVEAALHATAAVVFAQPDGRLFDPGRVNAHVARAEALKPAPDVMLALRAAQFSAAYALGDSVIVRRQIAATEPYLDVAMEPLLQCLPLELRGMVAMHSGNAALAMRWFRESAQKAAEIGLPMAEARGLALYAVRMLDDAQEPQEVLRLARKAREIARTARLGQGVHEMVGGKAEAEALIRLGRFAEAEALLDQANTSANEVCWSPLSFAVSRARLYLLTGRVDMALAEAKRLRDWDLPIQREPVRQCGRALFAWASFSGGADAGDTLDELERAMDGLSAVGGWPMLEREIQLNALSVAVVADRRDAARKWLRALDLTLDRIPSVSILAAKRRMEGIMLAHEGRSFEARQLVEGSLAGFVRAGDLPEAIASRRLLARFDRERGVEGAADRLSAADREMDDIGMKLPQRFAEVSMVGDAPMAPVGGQHGRGATDLAVPIARLTLRGLPPPLVHRELVDVLSGLFPGSAVRLDRIDASGGIVPLLGVGHGEPAQWTEFADGSGGRIRVGVSDIVDEDRVVVRALAQVTAQALEIATLRGLPTENEGPLPEGNDEDFLVASPSMRRLRDEIARLGASRSTVIVTGESGVGKEVVAHAIHRSSARSHKPFVAFNCAAVPRDLFEGQLFGYRKGAFTGANADHPGVIRAADGGTLFLDEVGELPLDVQPKLLRFLENGEVFPLGDRAPVHVDVRVIAATHRDLAELVKQKVFREDLFYRLQVVPLRVPPLRERPEDVVMLARSFVQKYTPPGQTPPALGGDALAALRAHPWPGNVRELRNAIERAMAFHPLPRVLGADHLRL